MVWTTLLSNWISQLVPREGVIFIRGQLDLSLRDDLRDQFSRLEHGSMMVVKYKAQFYELSRYAISIL